MKGFDPKFRDFPDYIIGITKEIWEDRDIASLHRYYAPDIHVRSPGGIVTSNVGVIADTMRKLAEFPDRQLFGEDVIWSGTPEEGMLSSHRIFCRCTHTGPGYFGLPTGKTVQYRVIADCHAIDNQINDEWLTYDQGAIVRQLGMDPRDWARTLIAREGADAAVFTPASDKPGHYFGRGNDNEWGLKLEDLLGRVMAAEMSVIPAEWDRAAVLHYAGGVDGHSHGDADRFWMGLRSSFPSATFEVQHRIGRDDPMMPPRAALRWSLHGKHDGWGTFGAPSGAEVYLMGFTHAEFGPWGLRREVTLYDEVSVWKQIEMGAG